MKIELTKIKIRELVEGYDYDINEGVYGYNGKLNIRPAYQREFVYNDKQQEAVIKSIMNGMPLNVMYWVHNIDGTYELLDGQQRTLSICNYVEGNFSVNGMYFHNLDDTEKEVILGYELMVYVCTEGSNSEKLKWFETINIAGEKLTKQELRNAIFTGPFITEAKKLFSKNNCPAISKGDKLLNGKPNRQEYLETVLKWISDDNIDDYIAIHQHDEGANELWNYFSNVIDWVNAIFPVYRKEMKKVQWGLLYNKYKDVYINAEKEVKELMMDVEVQNKKGIYEYIFTRDVRKLNLRSFDARSKREIYEKQNGMCNICGEKITIEEAEADHIIPWSKGGTTTNDNLQILCRSCNRKKSNK
jgi:hypothetical protein